MLLTHFSAGIYLFPYNFFAVCYLQLLSRRTKGDNRERGQSDGDAGGGVRQYLIVLLLMNTNFSTHGWGGHQMAYNPLLLQEEGACCVPLSEVTLPPHLECSLQPAAGRA